MAKKLIIIQNKPTQFDVPLYNQIAEQRKFELTVMYSEFQAGKAQLFDPEIERSPAWDHVTEEVYDRIDLSTQEMQRLDWVLRRIEDIKPDLVIISGYYPPLHRKLVKPLKKRGIRVGLRSDNTLWHSNFKGLKGLIKRLILPIWLRRYDVWHPVGSMAKAYLHHLSGASKPVFLFPYNVDNDWFFKNAEDQRAGKTRLLAKAGFPEGSFIVLGIMKWHEREDPITLIEAFKHLAENQANARLILVGDGPLRDEVQRRLHSVADKVYTPGYVPYSALPAYYAMADIFVHPAPDEPWGVSVNEAMACGVPVIAAEGVGAREDLIMAGETGFMFKNGDAGELAQLMADFITYQNKAAMRAACLDKMAQWHYRQTIQEFERALG